MARLASSVGHARSVPVPQRRIPCINARTQTPIPAIPTSWTSSPPPTSRDIQHPVQKWCAERSRTVYSFRGPAYPGHRGSSTVLWQTSVRGPGEGVNHPPLTGAPPPPAWLRHGPLPASQPTASHSPATRRTETRSQRTPRPRPGASSSPESCSPFAGNLGGEGSEMLRAQSICARSCCIRAALVCHLAILVPGHGNEARGLVSTAASENPEKKTHRQQGFSEGGASRPSKLEHEPSHEIWNRCENALSLIHAYVAYFRRRPTVPTVPSKQTIPT